MTLATASTIPPPPCRHAHLTDARIFCLHCGDNVTVESLMREREEAQLLRAIAVTTGEMLAEEHAGNFAERQARKRELYKQLIAWRTLPRRSR